jgi:hypothetical protein
MTKKSMGRVPVIFRCAMEDVEETPGREAEATVISFSMAFKSAPLGSENVQFGNICTPSDNNVPEQSTPSQLLVVLSWLVKFATG